MKDEHKKMIEQAGHWTGISMERVLNSMDYVAKVHDWHEMHRDGQADCYILAKTIIEAQSEVVVLLTTINAKLTALDAGGYEE